MLAQEADPVRKQTVKMSSFVAVLTKLFCIIIHTVLMLLY